MANYNLTIYPTPNTPPKRILTGQRFTRLLVIGYAGKGTQGHYWHCLCDCANTATITASNLLAQKGTRSCGCLRRDMGRANRTHGFARNYTPTPEYRAFQKARGRCNNPNDRKYHRYGKRGIRFCLTHVQELIDAIGLRPSPQHSLNRIDNNGHYEVGNIEWATPSEQARNTSANRLIEAFGKTQSLSAFAEEYGLDMHCLYGRIMHSKWCTECALTIPSKGGICPHKT